MQSADTATAIVAKSAPPLAVIGVQLAGIAVDDWIKYATLAYVLAMLVHKLWHMAWEAYRFWVLKRRSDKDNE